MVRMIIVGYYIDSDSYGIDSDGNESVTSSDNMSTQKMVAEDIVKAGQVVGKSTLALFGVKIAECLNLPDADNCTSHTWRSCSNFLGCRRRTMRIATKSIGP